ncbi:hypothetical protein [Acidisphaera sp. L21]|uniref:hypothetical protein n=1 Tax=Acidisphaera sp. L21 TaxID=1641851 RepID=UPI00131C2D59|nr:hypothetical protein [Acidisphaera sp. L21]
MPILGQDALIVDGFAAVIVDDATAGRVRDSDASVNTLLNEAGVKWVHSRALADRDKQ